MSFFHLAETKVCAASLASQANKSNNKDDLH
jgi:hypothetical protein